MRFIQHKFPIIIATFFLPLAIFGQDTIQNYGNLKMHNANVAIFGNFTNNGQFNSNTGNFYLSGTAIQKLNGTNLIQGDTVHMNNASGVHLDNELKISNQFIFDSGILTSDRNDFLTEFVHFMDNATYSGATDTTHVDGVVKKTGNDVFVFPVGHQGDMQNISISAPPLVTSAFKGYYVNDDPGSTVLDLSGCYQATSTVSQCEYWHLESVGGLTSVVVGLDWDSNSCGVSNECKLLVGRWDGTKWVSEGNGGTTGTTAAGRVVSGDGCGACGSPKNVDVHGYFTLTSHSDVNPLPIELVSFNAQPDFTNNLVNLVWETATEINCDFYEIQRSQDAVNWEPILWEKAAGNSHSILDYSTQDLSPLKGVTYYRLKNVDFDGAFEFSEIKSVNFDDTNLELQLFPNPASDFFTVKSSDEISIISIFSSEGKLIREIYVDGNTIKIDSKSLPKGFYTVSIQLETGRKKTEKLIVK